jgi:dipeptidyl-peptidase-4
MADTFPRQWARTQRLTLGEPRTISVAGKHVVFLRSTSGSDATNALWVMDVESGVERIVADPRMFATLATNESAEERSRRERAREGAGGIVSYSLDDAGERATFIHGGRLYVSSLVDGITREIPIPDTGTPYDARISGDGTLVAYCRNGAMCVTDLAGNESVIARDNDPNVSWGVAEFIAAEEIGRQRGHWWSPDSRALAITRVDVGPVKRTHIADPARPDVPPTEHRYPFAGTANARVTLHVIRAGQERIEVLWDRYELPYLTRVVWSKSGLVIAVQSRDQRTLTFLRVDELTGVTTPMHIEHDPQWVELVAGSPIVLDDSRLVWCGERNGVRAIIVDGIPITPADLQVRSLIGHDEHHITFTANELSRPTALHVMNVNLTTHSLERITSGDGVHQAAIGSGVTVVKSATLTAPRTTTTVHTATARHTIANNAEVSLVTPNVTLHRLGERGITTAIVLPTNHSGGKFPVLFDPYGGPHAQRVVESFQGFASAQWFADQGFVVVVADGRGTPARGSEWERAVHHDLATPVLEDQVAVLDALAEVCPKADLTRVGIKGWSFGGYLAALAVLKRPDRFHAAVAGAPVTDWRLYDTHYTERYLGHPTDNEAAYARTSLVDLAGQLSRPLLIIHGLADDNVLAAHSLQLSSALLEHGKAHEFLPLSGVTHMTPQDVVAENLLLHQLDFLKRSLA